MEGDCRVRLSRPPPLETDLSLVADAGSVLLRHGEKEVASARPCDPPPPPPPALPLEEARRRSHRYRGFDSHAFGSCFVCGPDRPAGDGLRIFPGAGADGTVACTWRPAPDLAGEDGTVRLRYVWAALDCPSGWAYLHPGGRVAVLGEFAVHRAAAVPVGEELVIAGRSVGDRGRKHFCASALYTADGMPLAWSDATWIDIDPASLQA